MTNILGNNMDKLYIIFPIYLLIRLLIGCNAENAPSIQINQVQEPACGELNGEQTLAIFGSSLLIQYSEAMALQMFIATTSREGSRITCIVTDTVSNKLVNSEEFPRIKDWRNSPMKLAYKIQNVTANTPLYYRIQCKALDNSTSGAVDEVQCRFYNVNISVIHDSAKDCTGAAIKTRNNFMTERSIVEFVCDAPDVIKNMPDVTYHWFKEKDGECVTDFNDNIYFGENGYILNLRNISLYDGGVYTCMAYHNDRKFILRRNTICVKYALIPNEDMELSCDAAKVEMNGNGTITCHIALSIAKASTGHYFWYKVGSNNDETILCNKTYSTDGTRVKCFEESSLDHEKCYYSLPTEDPPIDVRTITLNINNMKEGDFGEYRLEYRANIVMDSRLNYYVEIEMDLESQQRIRIAGIASGVLAMFLIFGLIALCLIMKMDILWFYKRHFGPYEQDIYPYMAYFVYHYQEAEYNGEANKKTKALVENMHEFMNKFGGTVFDEQKDVPLAQCDANSVLAVLNECHRIVLFLSADFVTDHWSRFATYSALEAVIKEGKKIILITTPETKSTLRDIEDEARRVLEVAMKRNPTIHWNGRVPFSGAFLRRLEYALPKRSQIKPDLHRYLSDSSQAQLTQYNGSPAKSLMEMTKTGHTNGLDNSCVA